MGLCKTMLQKIFIIIFLLLPMDCSAEQETTENKNLDSQLIFLKKNLVKIMHQQDKVYFESLDLLGKISESGELQNNFTLKKNEKFVLRDKHGKTEYELKSIDTDFIKIRYVSKFDHRSFGKNKVSIDSGVLQLEYTKKP